MSTYERSFVLTARDVDPRNCVRADAIASVLQESAAHHADTWGMSVPDLNPQGRTWVLARLAAEFSGRRPGWKEELRVETWSRGFRGHVATRDYIVHGPDGVAARATSVWFIIDLATRRPVRLTEYLGREEAEPERSAGIEEASRIDAIAAPFRAVPLAVRASDLDLNGHVNNSRYIEWLYESVPPEILSTRRISRLDINFLSETRYPETVELRAAATPPGQNGPADSLAFIHSVSKSDGVEAVRARSLWIEFGKEQP